MSGASRSVRNEVMECIAFYNRRGKDWSSAVEFILAKYSGTLDMVLQRGQYIIIPKWRVGRKRKHHGTR